MIIRVTDKHIRKGTRDDPTCYGHMVKIKAKDFGIKRAVSADDAELLTEDWLRTSTSFAKDSDEYVANVACAWLIIQFEPHRVLCRIESDTSSDTVRLNNLKTRDDLRRLCAALGIELKDASLGVNAAS